MTAIIELKQFDDVSPGLKAVINRDRQRYEVLRRAGSSCSNGVVFQSKDCFDDCFYNLNRAHHHHEEWNKLFKDYYEDLQEQGVEKAIEDPVSQTRSREADKDTCSGIYDDIDVAGRFGQSTQVPKPTPYKQEIIEKSTPKPTVAPTPETTKEDFEKPQKNECKYHKSI